MRLSSSGMLGRYTLEELLGNGNYKQGITWDGNQKMIIFVNYFLT